MIYLNYLDILLIALLFFIVLINVKDLKYILFIKAAALLRKVCQENIKIFLISSYCIVALMILFGS